MLRRLMLLLPVIAVAQPLVDLPEFLGSPTTKAKEVDPVTREFMTVVQNANFTSPEILTVIGSFINSHPSFGDAYGMRMFAAYCGLKQPASQALVDDATKALSLTPTSDGGIGSSQLYGLRARLDYDLGRYGPALDDLERGVQQYPDDADTFLRVNSTKPVPRTEEQDPCAWSTTELDKLASSFPHDYRVPLAITRGDDGDLAKQIQATFVDHRYSTQEDASSALMARVAELGPFPIQENYFHHAIAVGADAAYDIMAHASLHDIGRISLAVGLCAVAWWSITGALRNLRTWHQRRNCTAFCATFIGALQRLPAWRSRFVRAHRRAVRSLTLTS